MNSLPVIPLSTWAKGKSDDEVSDFLKGFSCNKNKEVQWFLRKLSMKFARLNISATHLVLSEDFERIVAYYTLVCKPLSVKADELGEDSRKSLEDFCRLNEQRGCIMSKDIGEYNTCPHLCHYCYANTNNTAALENWKRHCECPHGDLL